MSTISREFDQKDPAEDLVLAFNFGVALTNATVTIRRIGGAADASPAAMIPQSAVPVGNKGLIRVVGGVHGADYELRCLGDTVDNQKLVMVGLLRVRTDRAPHG